MRESVKIYIFSGVYQVVKKVLFMLCIFGYAQLSATIIETRNRTMFNALTKNNVVVVKFSAPWCGPCRAIRPVYERLSNMTDYKKITFLEVDIDELETVSDSYNIKSIPAFIFLNNGRQIGKPVMGPDEATLKKHLNQLLTEKE
jgi:thiol-disulfide isomerase/thioredoxin